MWEISNPKLNQVQRQINARDQRDMPDAGGTWPTQQAFFRPDVKAALEVALEVAHSSRRPGPIALYQKCKALIDRLNPA